MIPAHIEPQSTVQDLQRKSVKATCQKLILRPREFPGAQGLAHCICGVTCGESTWGRLERCLYKDLPEPSCAAQPLTLLEDVRKVASLRLQAWGSYEETRSC